MSPLQLGAPRDARSVRRHRVRVQAPLLLALVALWLVLWGHVDVISVATGVLFSVLVVQVFYLPAVALSGRVNLWWSFAFFVVFMARLLRASIQVAWLAVRPAPPPGNSIIAVPLRTRSDFLLTLTAEVNILLPGSVVVEADRLGCVLYLHVIGCDSDEKVERAREEALDIERRLALALGSRDDIWRINRDRRAHGLPPIGDGPRQRAHEQLREAQLAERRRLLEERGHRPSDEQLEVELVDQADAERQGDTDTEGVGG